MRNAAEAVSILGSALGLGDLAFNHEGACGIVIDDETEIFIHGQPEGGTLQLTAVVGDLHPGGPALWRRLLELNADGARNGPAAFAADPVTAEVVLTRQLAVGPMAEEELLAAVEEFVEKVEFWLDHLPRMETSGARDENIAGDAVLLRG